MPYCRELGHLLSRPVGRKAVVMEHAAGRTRGANQTVEEQTELVTETLVEEVSIDGMCGVY